MKEKSLFFLFLFLSCFIYSQEFFTISGYVEDVASGETLIGVNVYSKNLDVGTTTTVLLYYQILHS